MMVRASHVGSIILLARNGMHRDAAQKTVMSVPGILAGAPGTRIIVGVESCRWTMLKRG
jgi:hypothetical protein